MNELTRYEGLPVAELRDKVMDELVRQYSLERVTLEEFERRTELVTAAQARGEILAQLADLPPLPSERPSRAAASSRPRAAAAGQRWRVDPEGTRPNDFSLAFFGGSDYRGVWRAPRQMTSLCIFGGSKIDLREAVVPPEGVTISCVCLFGGLDVVVPPGMRVVTRGAGIFGGFDRVNTEPEDRDAPVIAIDGIALFGGVSVKVKS